MVWSSWRRCESGKRAIWALLVGASVAACDGGDSDTTGSGGDGGGAGATSSETGGGGAGTATTTESGATTSTTMSCPPLGDPIAAAEQKGGVEFVAADHQVYALVVEEPYAYLSLTKGAADSRIRRFNLETSEETNIVSGLSEARDLLLRDGRIFWTGAATVMSALTDGTDVVNHGAGLTGVNATLGLAATPTGVVWTAIQGGQSAIFACDLPGPCGQVVAKPAGGALDFVTGEDGIDAVGSTLFWVTKAGVHRVEVDGTGLTKLSDMPSEAIDVDGGAAFFGMESMHSIPTEGGDPVELYTAAWAPGRNIEADAAHVYFLSGSSVLRAPREGGCVERFARPDDEPPALQGRDLVVKDDAVYWATRSPPRLWRAAKP